MSIRREKNYKHPELEPGQLLGAFRELTEASGPEMHSGWIRMINSDTKHQGPIAPRETELICNLAGHHFSFVFYGGRSVELHGFDTGVSLDVSAESTSDAGAIFDIFERHLHLAPEEPPEEPQDDAPAVIPSDAAWHGQSLAPSAPQRSNLGWGEWAAIATIVVTIAGVAMVGLGYYLNHEIDSAVRRELERSYVSRAELAVAIASVRAELAESRSPPPAPHVQQNERENRSGEQGRRDEPR